MLISFVEKAQTYGLKLKAELDLTDIQAAAILGNIGYLSNGAQPNYREDDSYGPAWPKGTLRKGYGWSQWENKSDGTMIGPNFNLLAKIQQKSSASIVSSGGVGALSDLAKLRQIGIDGVVVGKALYAGQINLIEALDTCYK